MPIDPFTALSREQRRAMLQGDDVFLKACPGSGKTYSVAARFAWKARRGLRLAVLSHTNIASDEVRSAILSLYDIDPAQEHYSGTIHSFFTRYLLEPFGRLVAGAEGRVSVDENAVQRLNPSAFDLLQYRFTPTGSVVARRNKADISAQTLADVKAAKLDIAAKGFVSFDDAIYWSLQVLDTFPQIARALAMRFHEIIVDEAQDSSELQLACLRRIRERGLESLVLVGDFDQSIYGFGGAQPRLCAELARDAGLREARLTENYRSSQLICNVTAAFRTIKKPDLAIGPAAQITDVPKLITYDADDPSSLLTRWNELIGSLAYTVESRAILTRNNVLAGEIRPGAPSKLPKAYELLYQASRALPAINMRVARELSLEIIGLATGDGRARLADFDARIVRAVLIRAVRSVANLDEPLNTWLARAQTALVAACRELAPASFQAAAVPPTPSAKSISALTAAVSGEAVGDSRVGSVHSAKGESIDAVMLVAAPLRSWGTPEAETWASILTGRSSSTEENRIAYVGITRARRFLVLAVPAGTVGWAINAFVGVGFEPITN